ncbi:hypothetical protein CO669_01895 [Bradyrhizobium sp. Y36]|uniref:hypothetical protein n=1 Tax=Bradyrhizobium sp. Y36 TaxID=2035447 RepID=UPI000BEA0DEB|nr:hypothetical protein [Bradyrhizobium sp. Y36]PDT92047.1 hypothetical protein CO669_01895 [Bradyrhizobium sp. Y36]
MTATSKVTIVSEGVSINVDVVPDARRSEALRLIRAFLRLTDSGRRQRVLEWAERLAEDAGSAAEAPDFAATDPSAAASTGSLCGPSE